MLGQKQDVAHALFFGGARPLIGVTVFRLKKNVHDARRPLPAGERERFSGVFTFSARQNLRMRQALLQFFRRQRAFRVAQRAGKRIGIGQGIAE